MKDKLGSNASTTRERNIALIVRLLIREGRGQEWGISRTELANLTGLTQASITYITKSLMEAELVRETVVRESKVGHPSIGLAISREKYHILGVQINRQYVRAGLFTVDGASVSRQSVRFSAPTAPAAVLDHAHECIRQLLEQAPEKSQVIGMGVALPGPYLPARGRIRLMSGSPGWEEIDLYQEFKDRYKLPVFLEHDANCGALGQLWYGDVDDRQNILYVNVADGIGAGLICGGRLYRGEIGIAGEIGHMCLDVNGPPCECGGRGCMELYCSLKKLKSDYERITGTAVPSGEEVLIRAGSGQQAAVRALELSVSYLGAGLASLVNILNPGVIILSDTFALAGNVLIDLTERHMKSRLLREIGESVRIRLASEPRELSILQGAAAAALEQLLKTPSRLFEEGAAHRQGH